MNSSSSPIRGKNGQQLGIGCSGWSFSILREKDLLLSRFPVDRTVGFRRSKKESCSTRLGLIVGTDLVEF